MNTLLIFLFILPLSVFSQNDYITNKEYQKFINYIGSTGESEKEFYPTESIWFEDSNTNLSISLFLMESYFTNPYFKKSPVFGLSEKQIQAYIKWKYPNQKKIVATSKKIELNLTPLKERVKFTVGDYFKFYKYVRDSIIRTELIEKYDEEMYSDDTGFDGEEIDPPYLNWKTPIKWKDTLLLYVLNQARILTKENKVDNKKMNYTYYWIDFRRAARKDTNGVGSFIKREKINIWNKQYMEEFSSINIKEQLKDKTEIDYNSLTFEQLRAFYYWRKYKDEIESTSFNYFIPFENFIPDDDAIKLIQQGKLTDSFYHFKISISAITVK